MKIYRSPSEQAKTSENGMWAKLTACESSKEVRNNERQAAVTISISSSGRSIQGTHALQAIPKHDYIKFQYFVQPANYLETFQQQLEQIYANY